MKRMDRVMNMANEIVQSEELLSDNAYDENAAELDIERRKMDLAINLVEGRNAAAVTEKISGLESFSIEHEEMRQDSVDPNGIQLQSLANPR